VVGNAEDTLILCTCEADWCSPGPDGWFTSTIGPVPAGTPVTVRAFHRGPPCPSEFDVYMTTSAEPNLFKVFIDGVWRGAIRMNPMPLTPATERQNRDVWSGDVYDHHPDSLAMFQRGCATTSLSNALFAFGIDLNPGLLNNWLKENGGYTSAASLIWARVNTLGVRAERSPNFSFAGSCQSSNPTPLSDLDGPLSNCKLVIVQVCNPRSQGQHWVLVTRRVGYENYTIIDPGYLARSHLSDYSNRFWGMVTVGSDCGCGP